MLKQGLNNVGWLITIMHLFLSYKHPYQHLFVLIYVY